jgi:hypothetical protein
MSSSATAPDRSSDINGSVKAPRRSRRHPRSPVPGSPLGVVAAILPMRTRLPFLFEISLTDPAVLPG